MALKSEPGEELDEQENEELDEYVQVCEWGYESIFFI